jgi:hypothetical protein
MRVGSVMTATGLVIGGRPRSDDRGWLEVKVTAGRRTLRPVHINGPLR